jgi:protocatechuate 3,4-dioxygenase beta subunit
MVPGGENGEAVNVPGILTNRRAWLLRATALAATLSIRGSAATAREAVIGGPCEGCEWVFDGLPSLLGSASRIAPPDEPGSLLTLQGVVTTPQGRPAPGVVVYAYHTDRSGIYPPGENRHGRLRGWAITDAAGRYRFDTIRPGAYPQRTIPEHIHMHVVEPGVGTYYIDDVRFDDDPLLTAAHRGTAQRGGPGLARPERRGDAWLVRRDIALGRNIPGYIPR